MMEKGHKQTELQILPACACEFIETVVRKMRYRKVVREEVRAELTAHFEDDLKGCATDEEREQKARQLITDFGDVKLLAVLLRRAKKRCRPLWRKALVRSFQVVGVIILYFMICFGRFAIGTPTISVNYIDRLNQIVRGGRDEAENARPYYDKVAELYVKRPKAIEKKFAGCSSTSCGAAGSWLTDFNDVEMRYLLEWLTDNQPAFEMLRQGAQKTFCWTIYRGDEAELMKSNMMQNAMEPLSNYMRVARAMTWQIIYRAYSGDIEEALSDCIVLQEFGGHLQGKGLLSEQMVGVAIEARAHRAIFAILEKTDVPVNALKKTQEQLQNEYSKLRNVINLEGEKVFWYDLVQRGFTDDGKGDGRVLKQGLPFVVKNVKSALMGFFLWTLPDRREFMAIIERYFEQARVLMGKTPWQLQVEGESQKWDEIGKESIMLQILGPAHGRVVQLGWRTKTMRLGLLTMLAVLRYEKDNGEYPENLRAVVETGYLKDMPNDPYSDSLLVYKKTDESFILYSFGENLCDDGGQVIHNDDGRIKKWASEGDWVFWPVLKPELNQ